MITIENSGPSSVSNKEDLMDDGNQLFSSELSSPEQTQLRSVCLAWVLACIPGMGLGHLYAGMTQIFMYLVFLSIVGFLFYYLSGSYYSFALVVFSWVLDLGFAAYHVKQHNRRVKRDRKIRVAEGRQFLDSL